MKSDELKYQLMLNKDRSWVSCYLKSEADKVIADLQSKITLASLADECSNLRHKRCNYCSELQRQKYKRCLASAREWRSHASSCGITASDFNRRGFGKTAEKYSRKEDHAWKCVHRWLDIAKKFKEAQK